MTDVTDAGIQDDDARDSASGAPTDAENAAAGVSGLAAGIDWEALAAILASAASAASASPLPPYRRIWFQSLIRQGREAEAQGRAALAAHCFSRLEQEFKVFGITASGAVPGGVSTGSDGAPIVAHPDDAADVRAANPAPRASAAPHSALQALAARRDLAARARLRELLDRHASRLSPDEVSAFRQALEAAPEPGPAPLKSAPPAGAASISELRRRLLDRLMRAARYRRHAARLAAWKPTPAEGVAGPYNDYRALEDMLHRIASSNPLAAEWAAEFFDIYADMRDVKAAYGSVMPGQTSR